MRRSSTALTVTSLLSLFWLSMPPISATGLPPSPEHELIGRATFIFRRVVETPSAAIPASVMQRARALAVFPAAVGETGCYSGLGIVSARGNSSQDWTMPALIAFEGQIPLSLDVASLDFVFVALTPTGADYFKRPESALTGDRFIAPGPLGQGTPVKTGTDILAYMQFGDFFAGVTVRELSVRQLKDASARVYGKPYSTADVLRGGFKAPSVAQAWRDALASYFREMS